MKLGRSFHETIIERLRRDAEFREESLKVAIECLNDGETDIAEAMLRDHIYATIGYEKLGELMGKSPDEIKRMCHPDHDTSVNELFEIIHRVQQHEGIRLEVKVCSGEQDCESAAHDKPAEPVEAQQDLHPVSPS